MNELIQQALPTTLHQEGVWVVRVDRGNGKIQEYRCASEAQAKQLALVLNPPREN
jgi:hypothetical protein